MRDKANEFRVIAMAGRVLQDHTGTLDECLDWSSEWVRAALLHGGAGQASVEITATRATIPTKERVAPEP